MRLNPYDTDVLEAVQERMRNLMHKKTSSGGKEECGMKILNFGSLNFDHIYETDHFVAPKETVSSLSYSRSFGGKGLNQSIALAKAGMEVYHAGLVGYDGDILIEYLKDFGVRTDYLKQDPKNATGHAVIEVCHAENRIILFGGTNQRITPEMIREVLEDFEAGDVLLIQNEISSLSELITEAHRKQMKVVFNAAPMNEKVFTYPLDFIDLFIVNEVEGRGLAKTERTDYEGIIAALQKAYPGRQILLTAGADGSFFIHGDTVIRQAACPAEAVDTTAAGDTFTGYYLASVLQKKKPSEALRIASRAAAFCIQRHGAALSIPSADDLEDM